MIRTIGLALAGMWLGGLAAPAEEPAAAPAVPEKPKP